MKRNYLIAALAVSVGTVVVPCVLYVGASIASPVFLGWVAYVLIRAIIKTPPKVVLKTLGQLALGIVCLIPFVFLLSYLGPFIPAPIWAVLVLVLAFFGAPF